MKTESVNHCGIKIHHVHGYIKRDFWCESYHSHKHAEIFVHISGKMNLFIENNVYFHCGNEIRLYAPWELHFGKADFDQEMEWYQISLDDSFLTAHSALSNVILEREKGFGNIFISKMHENIVSLLEEIFQKQESNLSQHYLLANVIKILCLLNEPENNIDVKQGKNECLQNILEITNQNLTHIKTVENISQLTHFSCSYIYRLFKTNLNITPHQYIIMKKLSIAKRLLEKGFPIYDACFDSGFSDYSNFITIFRKHFGITPKHFQNTNYITYQENG
jgi:AraC-like DNA-binding protein